MENIRNGQTEWDRAFQELNECIAMIELGITRAYNVDSINKRLSQDNHQLIVMMGKITSTHEENTNQLLLTVGKLTHENEMMLRKQLTTGRGESETITENALRNLHDKLNVKEQEVEHLQRLNACLVSEVNELKSQNDQSTSIIYHLGQQMANHHQIISAFNATMLDSQAAEVREEKMASLLDQLELEVQFISEEHLEIAMLREDLNTDIDELLQKEQTLNDKIDAFQHISDLRDKEIQQMSDNLNKQIETFQQSIKAPQENAHLQEQREELERREAELRERATAVEREAALNRQQRAELERMSDAFKRKGASDGEAAKRSLDKRARELEEREKELSRRLKQLERDEADFRVRNDEVCSKQKEVDDIVAKSQDIIKRQRDIDAQGKEIAEARHMLHHIEQANKELEEKNAKEAQKIARKREKNEASFKAREQELEERTEKVNTMEQHIAKRLERVAAKELEIKETTRRLEMQEVNLEARRIQLEVAYAGNAPAQQETEEGAEYVSDLFTSMRITEVRFGPTCDASAQTEAEDLHMQLVLLELVVNELDLSMRRLASAKQTCQQVDARIQEKDLLISKMNRQATEDEKNICQMQETIGEQEEQIYAINCKLDRLRNVERELRDKTGDNAALQEMLAEKMEELLRKDRQYEELSASFKQSEQVMAAVTKRLLVNDQHMKEVQVEAAMRVQEYEELRLENEKLKERMARTKNSNKRYKEIIDQFTNAHEIYVAEIVMPPPDSPTGSADERMRANDIQAQIAELTLSHDTLYFEVGQAIAAKDVTEVKLKAKLLKIEEEFECMVRKNNHSMREYRAYLTDKQQREMDAYMKTYNAKLSELNDKLSDSEQSNLVLVQEKLELESRHREADKFNKQLIEDMRVMHYKHAALDEEAKELRIFRDTVQRQEGSGKKKGKDSQQQGMLELAEKNIQIRRLTEEHGRLKKQVETLLETVRVGADENRLIRGENEKLADTIKKIREMEKEVAKRVRLQVVNLSGVDNKDGNRGAVDSEALDKDKMMIEAARQMERTLVPTLDTMMANKNISRKHRKHAEKRLEQYRKSIAELQTYADAMGMEGNEIVHAYTTNTTEADSSPDSSSSSDSDDENPFAMGENGCVVARSAPPP